MSALRGDEDYWESVWEADEGYWENPRPAPTPDRSSRTTPEKHEGHGTSSTDRFRSEDTYVRAEQERLEAGLKDRRSPQDTAAAREPPSPFKLSGPKSRKQAKPKRPSMLWRFFTSPTKTSSTDDKGYQSPDSYHSDEHNPKYDLFARSSIDLEYIPQVPPKDVQHQQHVQHPAANALQARSTQLWSDPGSQEKAKHKHSSNRHGSIEEPARSRYEVDNPVHGEVNRQTSKTDFRLNGMTPPPNLMPERSMTPLLTLTPARRMDIGDSDTDSVDSQHTSMMISSRLRRQKVRSSKPTIVGLDSRIPTPREAFIDEYELETPKSISVVQIPVKSPKPVGIQFLSSITEPLLSREPEIRPKAFGWAENHLVLGPTDEDILVATNHLGHGSLGVVEEVRRIGGQFPTLVRKRVKLPPQRKRAAAYLNIVQEEARILRSLVHPHIVTLIGSYEDMKQSRRPSYCLLMSPVGENDLEAFLTIVGEHDVASEFSIRWRKCIRNWMACLASALKYMHASGIRHQDIKPSNIIHKGDHIFFTDFSSSSSFDIGHTTSTDNPTRSTPMYGAPEVTSDRQRHGRNTDIFSLGCVFSDMLTVVEGRTVQMFQDYLLNDGDMTATEKTQISKALNYSEKVPAIMNWFAGSHIFFMHVSQMLHSVRKFRPAATEVLQAFVSKDVCDASCSCLRVEY
jgi:hypothetical protein